MIPQLANRLQPADPLQPARYYNLYNRLEAGITNAWMQMTPRGKGSILLVLTFIIIILIFTVVYFLWESREEISTLESLGTQFEELSGFDLPCFARSQELCMKDKKVHESHCLTSCQMSWNCLTVTYNTLDKMCKLYFSSTPFEMGISPYQVDGGSIFVNKVAVFLPLHREEDDLFYFTSEMRMTQHQALSFCYDSFHYANIALVFDTKNDKGLQVAKTVASNAAGRMGVEVDLLIHIVAGGEHLVGASYPDVARRVDSKLKFQDGRATNAKLLLVAISADGTVKVPDFFASYYVLCQHDLFNRKGLSDFYSNLKPHLRTGHRRGRRSLFNYD